MSHSEEYYDKKFEEDYKYWSKQMGKKILLLILLFIVGATFSYLPHLIEVRAIPYLFENAKSISLIRFLRGSIYPIYAIAVCIIISFVGLLWKVLQYAGIRPERSDYY